MRILGELVLVIFCLVYPVVRYNVCGTTPWEDLPIYVLNKSFCIYTSVAFLVQAWAGVRGWLAVGSAWIHRTLLTAGIHILMSLCILTPAHAPKYFGVDGRLTLFAGLAMFCGVLASIIYWRHYCNSACLKFFAVSLNWGGVLVCAHLFFLGSKGWLVFEKWNGGMPPITLFCFLVVGAGVVISLFSAFKKETSHSAP